jgi:hypothetical protein
MHKLLKISAVALVAFTVGTAFAEDKKEEGGEKERAEMKKWCHHWREEREKVAKNDEYREKVANKEEYRKNEEKYEHRCRKHEGKEGEDYDDKEKKKD